MTRPQPLPRIQLGDSDNQHRYRVLSESAVTLTERSTKSWVTLTRTDSFWHPEYGRFQITHQTLSELIRNFKARTYGTV
ncbi:hypothetical protein [Sansalvadorimonas verongulae]|uniref:hypothetical protein n=1 Tax=Sansalvadorimonas verongulae TaxID=2172824 RepID=UPI0012BCDDA8|nr:hypothetical protein [Sansalvadorimonas verongulae]MTI15208.1 hypothetical protein [Sansalvadorimonas verongulae]